jgi:glyoxylase-like metal-dependent hydrolase (beta-lactamase superfamily II)
LEDELGDVLEKAMRRAGLNEDEVARQADVSAGRIRDAINYRPELSCEELRRLAAALKLNEVGLCALGCGRYPLPSLSALPFCVFPLRMTYGIGVTNAYLVAECGSTSGVLFDSGPDFGALEAVWPRSIRSVEAVFLTHVEAEHTGGVCEVVAKFGVKAAFCPTATNAPCGQPIGEGQRIAFRGFTVTAFTTPGHVLAHNCYLVETEHVPNATPLLVSGDLFFAGSVGAAGFCQRQLALNLGRMLRAVPPHTVIAPGHGPMTTAENELRYNPFVL